MPREMKGAVRVNALTLGGTGSKSLPAMEDHGKRLDAISRQRQVSRRRPLVHGTLDLRAAYDRHVAGAKMNAGATRPVLHMIVQYPDLSGPDAPAPFRAAGATRARQQLMLQQAVAWANETHGGDAVFAGRVDRDEAGQWTVDLFLAPKYEKITKTGKSTGVWVSTTKHGKELAHKHQDYIRSRHSKAKGDLTGPRHVGIALNADFREYFERENGVALTFVPKDDFRPDRLEPEVFGARRDRDRARAEAAAARAEAEKAEAAAATAGVNEMLADMNAADAKAKAEAARIETSAIRAAAETAAAEAKKLREAAAADATAAAEAKKAAETARADAAAVAVLRAEAETDRQAAAAALVSARDDAAALKRQAEADAAAVAALRVEAETDRRAAQVDRAEVAALKGKLRTLFGQVVAWLERRGLTLQDRREGEKLMRSAGLEPPPRPAEAPTNAAEAWMRRSARKEPGEEPGGPR